VINDRGKKELNSYKNFSKSLTLVFNLLRVGFRWIQL